MASNVLTVTAQGKNQVTRPLNAAAKDVERASKDFVKASKGVELASLAKNKAIGATKAVAKGAVAGITGLAKAGAGLAAIGVGAGAAIFSLAKSAADAGDQAFIASDRLGTSTEFLTQMGFAARQSGGSFEAVEKSMATLTKNALSGSVAFKRWGVEVNNSDGSLKSTKDLYLTAADRISGMSSKTEQLAAAQELFGRSGRELLPVLRGGAEGIAEFAARSDELGITISTNAAIVANEFNNQLGATQDTLSGVSRVAGSVFLPVLTDAMVAVQGEASKLSGEIRENEGTLQDYARDGIAAVASGFTYLLKTAKFFTQGLDGVRIGFKWLKVIAAESLAALLESLQATSVGGLTPLLDGLVAIGAIDTNPLTKGFDDLTSSLWETARVGREEMDGAIQGALTRGRVWDTMIKKSEDFASALKNTVGVTEKRLLDNKKEETKARTKNVLEIERESKAKGNAAKQADKDAKANERARKKAEKAAERDAKRDAKARDKAEKARNKKIQRDNEKQIEVWEDRFTGAASVIRSAAEEAITSTLDHTKTAGEAAEGFFADIGMAALNAALDFVIGEGIKQAAMAVTEALGITGAATSTAAAKVSGYSQVNAATAVAASRAMSAYADIPVVGPIIGAAAAGEMIAQIQGVALPLLAAKSGGLVPGAGFGDHVPAILEPGEFVVSRPIVEAVRGTQPSPLIASRARAEKQAAASSGGGNTFIMQTSTPMRSVDMEKWVRDSAKPAFKRQGVSFGGSKRRRRAA